MLSKSVLQWKYRRESEARRTPEREVGK